MASLLASKANAASGAIWTYEFDGSDWGQISHTTYGGAVVEDYPDCKRQRNFQSPINLVRSGSKGFDDYKIIDANDDATKKGYTN